MFILNEEEDILVNVDNVTKLYVDSNFVKVSLITGRDVLLKTCNNKAEAKFMLADVMLKLQSRHVNDNIIIDFKEWHD